MVDISFLLLHKVPSVFYMGSSISLSDAWIVIHGQNLIKAYAARTDKHFFVIHQIRDMRPVASAL